MREHLSIEQFDTLKKDILDEITKTSDIFDEMDDEQTIERLFRKFYTDIYKPKIDKLLTYDLSEIPANRWEDLILISMGEDVLDFEGTNANLNFKYLDTDNVEKYNFKSCRIRGLHRCRLYLDGSCFDDQFVERNNKYFLGPEFNAEFKKKFYDTDLTFEDYFALPNDLKEKLDTGVFISKLNIRDRALINSIFQLPPTIATLGGYKEEIDKALSFVKSLGNRYEEVREIYQYLFNNVDIYANRAAFEQKIKGVSAEEFITLLYDEVKVAISNPYSTISIEHAPKSVLERFPEIFFLDIAIDEQLRNKIYTKNLTTDDYLENYSVLLKRVNENYFRSSEGRSLARLIDSLNETELVEIFDKHKDFIRFTLETDCWLLNKIADAEENDFDTRVIEAIKKRYGAKRFLILGEYLKYLGLHSLEDLNSKLPTLSPSVRELFDEILNRLGIENVEKFDRISNGALTQNGLYNLVALGKYMLAEGISQEKIVDYENFVDTVGEYILNFIYDLGNIKFNYRPFRDALQNRTSKIFLTESEEMSLRSLVSYDIVSKFYDGSLTLVDILKNPNIIPILENKNLSFILRSELAKRGNLVESLGNERFLYFLKKYGLSIKNIVNKSIDLEENATLEDIAGKLLELLYEAIIDGYVGDFSAFPIDFKALHPQLFLISDQEGLNRKFAQRELSIEDFNKHPEYFEHFKYVDLFAGMPIRFSRLINSIKPPFSIRENENKLKVYKFYELLPKHNRKLIDGFVDYCARNIGELTDEKLKNASIVLERLEYSNSGKLSRLKNELADMILNTEDPIETLNKIERLYLTNNLPDVAKVFSVFRILHSAKDGTLSLNLIAQSSPVLNAHSKNYNEIIIYSDLLRAALESNNLSLRNYIHSLEEGARLLKEVDLADYDSLSIEKKEILKDYSRHLTALFNQTSQGHKENFTPSGNIPYDLSKISSLLGESNDINDRIVRMFMHLIGIDTLEELKTQIEECVRYRDEQSRTYEKGEFTLEEGDMIKGLNSIDFLFPTMQNGALATEFLGSAATEFGDMTPLDTDLSYITSSNSDMSLAIMSTISAGYGPIWVVIKKDNPKIYRSRGNRGKEDSKYHKNKIEAFRTASSGHYGIRTGFGSTNIDFIITENYTPHIGLAIAMQGFYIPVVDKTGALLFTSKMFDDYKSQMEGLSYYGLGTYRLSGSLMTEEIVKIANMLDGNKKETMAKSQLIKDTIASAVREIRIGEEILRFDIKNQMDGNLEPGVLELIDIGSTGRGTNEIGDGDFDYIVRVDSDIMKSERKLNALKESIMRSLGQSDTSFRYKGVKIDGIATKVDIDISFVPKTDSLNYSTDEAIRDRLNTIQNNNPQKYSYVLANIIYAKRVLKSYNCYYKQGHSKCVYGGLGGVGVETWILTNHGSFIEAAKSFLEVANKCATFEDFKKEYKLWDFGENFYFEKKSPGYDYSNKYDEFIYDNMDALGYEAMKKCLVATLNKIERENFCPESIEQSKTY